MTNLTKTAVTTRKAVKVLGGLLLLLMISPFLWRLGVNVWKFLNPPPPPLPTVGFGRLPAIEFPIKTGSGLNFRLETVDGTVPSFGPTAKVFLVTFPRSQFLDLDKAKKQAASLGFVLDPVSVNERSFRWNRSNPVSARLDMDTVDNTFEMQVAWQTDPSFLDSRLLPSKEQAVTEAKSYLKQAGFLPSDLENGVAETRFLLFSGGKLLPALSQSDADFIEVNLYRAPIDGARVLPADPDEGVAKLLISGNRGQGKRIVEASYRHKRVDYNQLETYPLISGPQAWQMLIAGQGFVAREPDAKNEAVVRSVSLGYLDSLNEERFLQPIYVFEGDGGFMGYVSAVDPVWIQGEVVDTTGSEATGG